MIELLVFVGLCVGIIAVAFSIPFLFKFAHDTESDKNHIYNVFMEVSGPRCFTFTSSIILFVPIGLVNFSAFDQADLGFIIIWSVLWLYSAFLHLQLYKLSGVVDAKLKRILFLGVLFSVAAAVAEYFKVINWALFVYFASGSVLGFTAIHNRAKLLQAERRLKA